MGGHGKSDISVLIVAILLYLSRVRCTRNGTGSREDFLENCCIDNDTSDRPCDLLDDSNGTWPTIPFEHDKLGNVSPTPCCKICVSRESESETEIGPQQPARRDRFEVESRTSTSSIDSSVNASRVCIEHCFYGHRDDENFTATRRLSKEGRTRAADRPGRCDSVFSSLRLWGASIVVFANAIYIIPYVVVAVIYLIVPGLNARAFGRVVICYNVTQIVLNLILIGVGACELCHVPLRPPVYVAAGLSLMFLTISSTFWLFAICVDVTLAITRFSRETRTESKKRQERTKFSLYAGCTWAGSLLPTILASIAELSPLLPESSPIRPNFANYKDGANLPVILYVITFPVLTLLANTLVFVYASFKMRSIQRSINMATANSSVKANKARQRYFLYLRLYLLMDAPWITSALAAVFSDLWLLKFFRMIQPILMLLSILPPRTATLICCRCYAPTCTRGYDLNRSKTSDGYPKDSRDTLQSGIFHPSNGCL